MGGQEKYDVMMVFLAMLYSNIIKLSKHLLNDDDDDDDDDAKALPTGVPKDDAMKKGG